MKIIASLRWTQTDMAFTDFKSIAQVQEAYRLKYAEEDFIVPAEIKPSAAFREELEFSRAHMDIFSSEAARCENVIYPLLREVYKHYAERYTLWSHKSLRYDETLNGTPDYLLAEQSELGKTVLGHSILVVVEAKQSNFIEGWGQCLAELVAAQKLDDENERAIYGIVTDAELWQFGRLRRDVFTRQQPSIALAELDKLFGAVGYLLAE